MRIDFPSKEQKIAFFFYFPPYLLSYYIPSYKGIVLFLSSNHSYLPFVEPIELPFIVDKSSNPTEQSRRLINQPFYENKTFFTRFACSFLFPLHDVIFQKTSRNDFQDFQLLAVPCNTCNIIKELTFSQTRFSFWCNNQITCSSRNWIFLWQKYAKKKITIISLLFG